ncbi:MAG: hypothetical protein ACHREM_32010 [Polyangiales bacterium]
MSNFSRVIVAAVAVAIASLTPSEAAARLTIRELGGVDYTYEIEPHLDIEGLGADGTLFGLGAGLRVSIAFIPNGFIRGVNDSVAISFGGDFVHFPSGRTNCGNNGCATAQGFDVLYAPVAMQWNFFLTDKWSVFGEPGIALRHSFASDCGVDPVVCDGSDRARFVFAVGGRYHLSQGMTLTLRAGVPVLASVGLSFF